MGEGQVNVMAMMVCNMSNQLSWLQCMYHIDTEHTSVGGGGGGGGAEKEGGGRGGERERGVWLFFCSLQTTE